MDAGLRAEAAGLPVGVFWYFGLTFFLPSFGLRALALGKEGMRRGLSHHCWRSECSLHLVESQSPARRDREDVDREHHFQQPKATAESGPKGS